MNENTPVSVIATMGLTRSIVGSKHVLLTNFIHDMPDTSPSLVSPGRIEPGSADDHIWGAVADWGVRDRLSAGDIWPEPAGHHPGDGELRKVSPVLPSCLATVG